MKAKTCQAQNPTICRHHGIPAQYANRKDLTVDDIVKIKNITQESVTKSLKLTQPVDVRKIDLHVLWNQSVSDSPQDPTPEFAKNVAKATEAEYLKEYKTKKPKVTKPVNSSSNWIEVEYGEYKVQAKVFETGSGYGIDDGRISKLSIYNKTMQATGGISFFDTCIVNYDRGWDFKAKGPLQRHVYKEVIKTINEHLDDIYGKDTNAE